MSVEKLLRSPGMWNEIKTWFNLAEVGQSRSSITNPLQWTMVILGGSILLAVVFHAPAWITTCLAICLFVVLAVFVYAYLFFMHKNPDVLRSENYHLSKMAIERGLVGDSLHGLLEAPGKPGKPLQIQQGVRQDGQE